MTLEQTQPRDIHVALTLYDGLGLTILETLQRLPDNQGQVDSLGIGKEVNEQALRNTFHNLLTAELVTESPDESVITLTPEGLKVVTNQAASRPE